MSNNEQIFTIEKNENSELDQYSFEDAIVATGFGKYNIILILMCGLGILGVMTESAGLGIVIPPAKCDLELTSSRQGLLTTISVAGVLLSSQVWGYLGDTRGRRAMMIVPVFVSVLITVSSSMAVNFYWLIGLKFIGGVLHSSSASNVYAYVSEFHGSKHRPTVLTVVASFISFASFIIPALAWILLPANWSFDIDILGISYKPWRLLIALCSLPNLIFVMMLLCFPESPRFLLQKNQSEKALAILRNIYSWNTGNDVETFPVKKIVNTGETAFASNTQTAGCFSNFYKQLIPIFLPPFWMKTLLVSTLQFGGFYGGLGVYNWVPHILNEFFEAPPQTTICEVFDPLKTQNITIESYGNNTVNCVATVNLTMLESSFFLGLVMFITYLFVACFVKYIGNKIILIVIFLFSGLSCCFMHTVQTSWITLLLMCLFILSRVTIGLVNSFTPDMFPTQYRAMAISVSFMVGRIGGIIGSNLMGALLDSNCNVSFYISGGILLLCGLLSFQLPSHGK